MRISTVITREISIPFGRKNIEIIPNKPFPYMCGFTILILEISACGEPIIRYTYIKTLVDII